MCDVVERETQALKSLVVPVSEHRGERLAKYLTGVHLAVRKYAPENAYPDDDDRRIQECRPRCARVDAISRELYRFINCVTQQDRDQDEEDGRAQDRKDPKEKEPRISRGRKFGQPPEDTGGLPGRRNGAAVGPS